jgi:dienelactone hydrolase
VFRPEGQGPWPVVVFLHGQAGFANFHLRAGPEIARSGFVTVVGCWFGGHYDGASQADPPPMLNNPDGVSCPDGPAIKPLRSTAAIDDVSALMAAARELPDVTARLGLVGYSRGALTTVFTASGTAGSMQAVAAMAGSPPVPPTGGPLTQAISAPVLLLHGEADEVLPVQNARNLESALRALGKPVEAQYYPGANHGFFFDPQWHAAVMERLVTFLRATLRQ